MTHDSQPGAVRAFFVYGTLMRAESNHGVVARHGLASVRAGRVRGTLFDTGEGYPAMRPAADDSWVHGEVLVPQDFEAALRAMDELEGYAGEDADGNLYERCLIEVDLEGGDRCVAWTYVYAQEVAPLARIASGSWRDLSGR